VSLALLGFVPVALGGEAVNGNNTALGVLSVVSVVFGFLLIAALWFFVFREKARSKRRNGRSD
jgi:hypothetical protein